MMKWAVSSVGFIFSKCWTWMRAVFDATGALPYYLAALLLFLVIQVVLLPLRGGRMFSFGSDLATAMKDKTKDG